MTARKSRIVLFPYGQPPHAEQRELCAQFFLSLGGDVSRVIDGPFANVDRFANYAKRIPDVSQGSELPILVLCKTNPLALTVVGARNRIVQAIPVLQHATWVLFVDPSVDPFFTRAARDCGRFVYEPGGLRWLGPDDAEFLIAGLPLSPSEGRSLTPPPHSIERVRTRRGDEDYEERAKQMQRTGSEDDD